MHNALEHATPARSPVLQDLFKSKLRLFVAAGLGIVLLNAGASAAFDWYYHKTGEA